MLLNSASLSLLLILFNNNNIRALSIFAILNRADKNSEAALTN